MAGSINALCQGEQRVEGGWMETGKSAERPAEEQPREADVGAAASGFTAIPSLDPVAAHLALSIRELRVALNTRLGGRLSPPSLRNRPSRCRRAGNMRTDAYRNVKEKFGP